MLQTPITGRGNVLALPTGFLAEAARRARTREAAERAEKSGSFVAVDAWYHQAAMAEDVRLRGLSPRTP